MALGLFQHETPTNAKRSKSQNKPHCRVLLACGSCSPKPALLARAPGVANFVCLKKVKLHGDGYEAHQRHMAMFKPEPVVHLHGVGMRVSQRDRSQAVEASGTHSVQSNSRLGESLSRLHVQIPCSLVHPTKRSDLPRVKFWTESFTPVRRRFAVRDLQQNLGSGYPCKH